MAVADQTQSFFVEIFPKTLRKACAWELQLGVRTCKLALDTGQDVKPSGLLKADVEAHSTGK
ncbi:MAG: hypothetical protein OXH98_02920 [Caldilineaceae bacterium]|nr:hypothetical protein [Caldilineaceae bacterium]